MLWGPAPPAMRLLWGPFQHWLYVASDSEVTQVGTSLCAVYGTCQDCILARDPACAWSPELGLCSNHRGQAG